MRRIIALIAAALLLCGSLVFPAFAADPESQISVEERARELSGKYGIDITFPKLGDGAPAITSNNLETLDLAFSNLGTEMVRQVSEYYERRGGSRLKIEYVLASDSYQMRGGVLMAAFEHASARILIFLPKSSGRAIISGENPIALVHEFGHAFYIMCGELGDNNASLRREWSRMNGGYIYDPYINFINPDETVFVSGYATTSFVEDYAETFGHAFARSQDGVGFAERLSSNGQVTALGNKLALIEEMINTYIDRPEKAVANFRRVYSARSKLDFEGGTFSGEHLQYIGYPQPRNVLNGILSQMGFDEPDAATWVRKLGAWRITEDDKQYFIFPGGIWSRAA